MTTPELEDLERLLSEDAPEPSPEFAARMEKRLEEGFPRRRRLPTLPRLPRLARLPRAALAGIASAALALSVSVALLTGDGDEPESGDRPAVAPLSGEEAGGGRAADTAAQSGGEAAAPAPGPGGVAIPSPGGVAPDAPERHIERSAQLTITTPDDDVGRAGERIVAVTDRHRGFVLRSEMRTGEEGDGGTFELRVPQERLRPALRDLAAIGDVRSRSEQGQDVTPAVSRTEERLEEARTERRGLLRRLERADDDREARAIRRRLRLVSAEIRSVTRELRALRERVDYAAVTVTLQAGSEDGGGAGAGSDGGAGAALDDALGSLEGALELAIRALGVLLPLSLLGGAGWLAARLVVRRRRDAALS